MAKFKVSLEKENELLRRMAELGIREEDLVEKFLKGSGPGGQKINKTSSCVYLLHSPTGIEVKCQQDRSQAMNRYLARRELCERIATKILNIKTEKKREIHKLKKQKKKRSKRAKEKMLRDKGLRSQRKRLRDKVRSNHD